MTLRKFENLLKSSENSDLERLIKRARSMDSLTSALRAKLPVDLAANLVAANVRDDAELVLICSTPAWAARFRFEADTLLRHARDAGAPAKTCLVRVCR